MQTHVFALLPGYFMCIYLQSQEGHTHLKSWTRSSSCIALKAVAKYWTRVSKQAPWSLHLANRLVLFSLKSIWEKKINQKHLKIRGFHIKFSISFFSWKIRYMGTLGQHFCLGNIRSPSSPRLTPVSTWVWDSCSRHSAEIFGDILIVSLHFSSVATAY